MIQDENEPHDAGDAISSSRPPRYGAFNPRPILKSELPAKPLTRKNQQIADALKYLDLGSGIAEQDTLLHEARVETSAFSDLLNDRVDLVPGTKGSGKSALYRLFVEYFAHLLLITRKTVVTHGVTTAGDSLFNIFSDQFSKFDEDDFKNFWCVYLISLANTQFVQNRKFADRLAQHNEKIAEFHESCKKCNIPLQESKNVLIHLFRQGIDWVCNLRPSKVKYELPTDGEPGGSIEVQLGRNAESEKAALPTYIYCVKENLEVLLEECDLNLWLMVDRLDEIFPRRSSAEKTAMRGLLRTLRVFESKRIRVKLFIRDDMLDAVVGGGEGFTALSHVTARKADVLRWSEENILTMIVKRAFASPQFRQFIGVDLKRLNDDRTYRTDAFYRVFPPTADGGTRRSSTMKWIYSHLSDGRGVVTPRDVIDLLTIAKQRQQDLCQEAPNESSEHIISSKALKYALTEVSKLKRTRYLEAEFPHMWPKIKMLVGGKTELNDAALKKLYGEGWSSTVDDLVSLGVLRSEMKKGNKKAWKVPFIYRAGLDVKQGQADNGN